VLALVACTAKSQCGEADSYYGFHNRWNDNVGIFNEGGWKLPKIDFAKQKRDTIELVQQLVQHGGVTFFSMISKSSCIKKISLKVKKDTKIETEAVVGILYLYESFNPELNPDKRQKEFKELKAEAETKNAPATKKLGGNTYMYEPGTMVNVFTVELGR
jgi:hypothetical protein